MKFITLLVLPLGLLLCISCSKDKDEVVGLIDLTEEQFFTFLDTTYELKDGIVIDYGGSSVIESNTAESHYNYDFTIADQSIVISNGDFDAPNAKFALQTELFSPGTPSFQAGVFNFVNLDQASAEDINDKYVFKNVDVILLDGSQSPEGTAYYRCVGGTVVVTDNGSHNYTLSFDVNVQQYDIDTDTLDPTTEISVKLTYTNTFKYLN